MQSEQTMNQAEVIQSMRVGTFGDFIVLGSQYRDQVGEIHWYIAVLPDQGPNNRIYHVIAGELPDELDQDERHAVIEAIRLWESQPISRPN